MLRTALVALLAFALNSAFAEQLSSDPFPPIEATKDVIAVSFVEFAKIPEADGGEAPRLMHMIDEPATKRLFVSTMRGMLYGLSYDGKKVSPYLDVNAKEWGIDIQYSFSERGLQSIAFHPQFAQRGAPGYGKFYTYTDTKNMAPKADFTHPANGHTHDLVLLEWTAKNPASDTYDGGAPKELFRAAKPFVNHNGGEIAFNPLAKKGDADYGLLYVGLADGGSGGDPANVAQNLGSEWGKILRIDPLGTNSKNGKYGIPASNPFANDGKDETLGEIYAYGLRNPQRFNWDPKNGRMLVADIGQNVVEKVSLVTAGANLGWVKWEGSYKYAWQIDLENPRSEEGITWPIVEFDHTDPLLQRQTAITGVVVYRATGVPALKDLLIFGDNPTGEIFYVKADAPPSQGSSAIRRILFKVGNEQRTLLQVVNDKLKEQGKSAAQRIDLRFGFGPKQEIFVMNKRDGVIRLIVRDGTTSAKVG